MLASEISRSQHVADIVRSHGNGCLVAFADAIKQPSAPTIESFLMERPEKDRSQLAGLIAIEMRHRFDRNQPCRVEGYVERFPQLREDREQMLDLIYAEYCARRSSDPGVSRQEYYDRFPSFRDMLERAFRIASVSISLDAAPVAEAPDNQSMSHVKDMFLEFRLRAPMGRGAFATAFLAEQTNLSDRRVVVKITDRNTIEHRTMARLQHPNIVPILSVHHDDKTNLQAVCMPYQHAAALSDVRSEWSGKDLAALRGEEYMRAVRVVVRAEFRKELVEPSDTAFPKNQTFAFACAWIMHKLAGALHHAHERGIYHRDLKPSNILLSVTGQPLLVDFNLSFSRLDSSSDVNQLIGGTLPYMPPEQIRAVHPIEQGRVDDVGSRSDVFALGATIFELVTGQFPFGLPEPVDRLTAMELQLAKRNERIPSARELNSSVPADFDALLRKCLAPLPHQRYDSAAELAEDLRLFLEDRPLRYVPAPSRLVRIQKFVRRNRRRLATGTAIAAIVIAVSTFVAHAHLKATREQQARLKSEFQVSQYQTSAEKEADAALSRTLLEPDDGQNYYRCMFMGGEYLTARQYGHANRCLTRSIEIRSDFWFAYVLRARCFANLDKDAEALADYTKAIDLSPNEQYPLILRGVCYGTSTTHGDAQLALRDLDRARELMPPDAGANLKIIYLELARALSAVSTKLPTAEEREQVLVQAEEDLRQSLNRGLEVAYLTEIKVNDRFKMLDPLFDRPNVRKMIADRAHK